MTLTRREWLGNLGLASASALLWSFGCGGPIKQIAKPVSPEEVGPWLRDAVARLAGTYPYVQALAVSRRRASAAVDVLGAGVARARRDGVVITVGDAKGARRERVTSSLTAAGIAAAVHALEPTGKRIEPTAPPATDLGAEPVQPSDRDLLARTAEIGTQDQALTSRIVYAASLLDLDDAIVWSVGRDHDRVQRERRIVKRAIRASWNGTQPVLTEYARGWSGGIDAQKLDPDAVMRATREALELMTPGDFEDAPRAVVLDAGLAALLVETGARTLLTADAAARPELAARIAPGAVVAAPAFTLVDDPTAPNAYGGFRFDDAGVEAKAITLVDAGAIAGQLGEGRARRPGHLGNARAEPSHLRVAVGTGDEDTMVADGLRLEGALGVSVSPSSPRVVLSAARAREFKGGQRTGRVYADVELVGDLPALLGGITSLGATATTIPFRDEVEGEPRWRSVETPAIASAGFVRARRRRA